MGRRLGIMAATLLVSSFVIFGALYLAPGTPLAALSGGKNLPPSAVRVLNRRFDLNQPFLERYWHWLTGVLHGDFGYSVVHQSSVSTLLSQELPISVELILYAGLLTVVFGIVLGMLSALRPGKIDDFVLALTAGSAAMPAFVAGIVLVLVFSVDLGWLPALGQGGGFASRIRHLTLPAVAMALAGFALIARVTRTSMREQLQNEHVQTAVSRGVGYGPIVRRHVMRNASIPIVTSFVVVFATLISLDPVVESVFSISGVGGTLVNDALEKDIPSVQGVCLVLIAAFVVMNTVVDLAYRVLDPRLKDRS
ncbi:MAG: ABC transporter permease [Acidobacteriota bacterium]|nr:ABC transporter permease [Acidobacteriota bacterium]